eukprot:4936028-Pleurochrysis_carterae.AAC.6
MSYNQPQSYKHPSLECAPLPLCPYATADFLPLRLAYGACVSALMSKPFKQAPLSPAAAIAALWRESSEAARQTGDVQLNDENT